MIGWSFVVLLAPLSGCQTPLKPCDCGVAVIELRDYTERYHQCLEDKGNLRQQLKAERERR